MIQREPSDEFPGTSALPAEPVKTVSEPGASPVVHDPEPEAVATKSVPESPPEAPPAGTPSPRPAAEQGIETGKTQDPVVEAARAFIVSLSPAAPAEPVEVDPFA